MSCVRKMGNIVPRVGLESTFLAFRDDTITLHRLTDVTTIPMPTCLCSSLPQRSAQTTTHICTHMHTYALIYTQRYKHTLTHIKVDTCTRSYINIHIHTYIHTYIHTQNKDTQRSHTNTYNTPCLIVW